MWSPLAFYKVKYKLGNAPVIVIYKSAHQICFFILTSGDPFNIKLNIVFNCKIKNTDVALKGQTVSSSYKPATLDNGINIQVPPFIESEDEIIIDTRTIEYVKKT